MKRIIECISNEEMISKIKNYKLTPESNLAVYIDTLRNGYSAEEYSYDGCILDKLEPSQFLSASEIPYGIDPTTFIKKDNSNFKYKHLHDLFIIFETSSVRYVTPMSFFLSKETSLSFEQVLNEEFSEFSSDEESQDELISEKILNTTQNNSVKFSITDVNLNNNNDLKINLCRQNTSVENVTNNLINNQQIEQDKQNAKFDNNKHKDLRTEKFKEPLSTNNHIGFVNKKIQKKAKPPLSGFNQK